MVIAPDELEERLARAEAEAAVARAGVAALAVALCRATGASPDLWREELRAALQRFDARPKGLRFAYLVDRLEADIGRALSDRGEAPDHVSSSAGDRG